MIEWHDEAVVLSSRPHGENALIVMLLTRGRGRHAGLAPGGQGGKGRALYQPGNLVAATWRARLADHLGTLTCELRQSSAAALLDDAARLSALTAAAAVCDRALPEREPHPACYDGLQALLQTLESEFWAESYVKWELGVLADLGFGLDLSQCAGGGDNSQLAYVSPRSGRAVSLAAGEAYRDKLLGLPGFLVGRGSGGPGEVALGLAITGHFLVRHVFHPHNQDLPQARHRLAARFAPPKAS